MILADANVLSETSKSQPDPRAIRWIAENFEQLYMPAPVLSELRYGCEKLPKSARRSELESCRADLLVHLSDRVLPFDRAAGEAHGAMRAELKAIGKPCPPSDSYIAAMAISLGCPVATRNLPDFQWTGVALIDPWNP